LAEALESSPDLVRGALASRVDSDDAFTALNTAYLHDGVFIELDANAILDIPLHLIFLSAKHGAAPVAANARVVVSLGENSEACLLESHLGLEGAANFTNLVTDVSLARGARLRHLRLVE